MKDIMLEIVRERDEMKAKLDKEVAEKKAKKDKSVDETVDMVKNLVKERCFFLIKFLQGDNDLKALADICFDMYCAKKGIAMGEQDAANWKKTYAGAMKQAVNERRNYCQSQMKGAALELMDEQEKKGQIAQLPPLKMLQKCALRQIDLNNLVELAIFKWYWVKLIGRVCGRTWNESKYYFHTICNAMQDADPEHPMVAPSTEAFLLVIYENNEKKWPHQRTWKSKNGNANLPPRSRKNRNQAHMTTKWTNTDKGQQPYGGWDSGALQQMHKYKNKIARRRKYYQDEINELESKMLKILRKENNIDSETSEEERNKKRKKKRKRGDDDDDDEPQTVFNLMDG